MLGGCFCSTRMYTYIVFPIFRSSHSTLIEIKVQAQNSEYDIDCVMVDGMDQNKTGI